MARVDVTNYRWQNRLLLVFAPSPEHERVQAQQRLFGDQDAELRDRDLLLAFLFPEGGSVEDAPVPSDEVASLRERYGVAKNDFIVLLIGKDGTAKKRLEEPITPADLFALIDAMPMRQQEMKEGETEGD